MGLFGKGDKGEEKAAESAALVAEYERVAALPLADLGAEVMERGFGPGSLGENPDVEIRLAAVLETYGGKKRRFGVDYAPLMKIDDMVKEAGQALTNAGLLMTSPGGEMGIPQYRKTRAGQESLDTGQVKAKLGG